MGMPITSYNVFRLLAHPETAHVEVEKKLQETLAKFQLLAVVLHDPDRHKDLHDLLTSNFEVLDEHTGQHLLFFAMVEVSEQWRGIAEHRHYFSAVEKMLKIEYAKATPIHTIDAELACVQSALALGIPTQELPCIVVLRGDGSEFCWFGTSHLTIERQLRDLALAAGNMVKNGTARFDDLEQYLRYYKIDLGSASISVLTSLLAILAPSVTDPQYKSDAYYEVQNAIKNLEIRLLQQMQTEISGRDEDWLSEFTRSVLNLGIAIARSHGGTASLEWPWPSRNLWEIEAAASLATAMKLRTVQYLETLAPIVICYGRAFEVEINASIVQDMRRLLGVEMPAYWQKYNPRVSARVRKGDSRIDLNAIDGESWKAVEIGKALEAAMRLKEKGNLVEEGWLDRAAWDLLLKEWGVIRDHRNYAAHVYHVDESSVTACHDAYSSLNNGNLLTEIIDLKNRLRGQKRVE